MKNLSLKYALLGPEKAYLKLIPKHRYNGKFEIMNFRDFPYNPTFFITLLLIPPPSNSTRE